MGDLKTWVSDETKGEMVFDLRWQESMKRRAGTEDVRAEQGGDVQNILRKESYTKVRGYTVQKGKIVDSQPKD